MDNIVQNMNTIKINTNDAIIYCRVSTKMQQNGTSLDLQKTLCKDYCALMRFNSGIYESEICSATLMSKQHVLNNIINNHSNINLVILEPSRLCRNIKDFTCLLEKCNKKNIILHFAQTATSSTNTHDIKTIFNNVFDAECESKTIGKRVKTSISYRKRMKCYVPSVVSFGHVVINKNLCINPKEQDIIVLINKLYHGDTVKNINELLYKITNIKHTLCYLHTDEVVVNVKYGNMKIVDIVHLLNDNEIKRRNRMWYGLSVSKLIT